MDLLFAWPMRQFLSLTGSYGASIILFAILVRLIMLPFMMKTKKSSMRMTRLNPRVKELEKKYEGNQQKYQEEVSRLYKEEKINPLGGCLWTLVPFPIMIGLLSVIRQPLTKLMGITAEQVTLVMEKLQSIGMYTISERLGAYYEVELAHLVNKNFEAVRSISDKLMSIDFTFLGMNMGATPQWNFFLHVDWSNTADWLPALGLFMIPILSAVVTYVQMKISMKNTPALAGAGNSNLVNMLMMPAMSLYFGFTFPAAMGIYWMVGYVFAIPQDIISNRYYGKILDAEEAGRNERFRLRDEEIERKRQETERLRAAGLTERNKSTSKKKLSQSGKQEEERRRAEENKQNRVIPASQVGSRRYARGRAYIEDRFTNPVYAEGGELFMVDASTDADDEDFDEDIFEEYTDNADDLVDADDEDDNDGGNE